MISSETRVAGPFNGNGVTTVFAFAFKVFQAADLVVIKVSTAGLDSTLVLNTNYTVALNADQDNNPGGTVTTIGAGSPLANGEKLFVYSDMAETQPAVLLSAGGWFPKAVENALDRANISARQASMKGELAIRFPISEQIFPAELPKAAVRAGKALFFDGAGVLAVGALVGAMTTTITGQIPFGAAANTLAQDSNLFWDNVTKRLGIGNAAPTVTLDVTGAIKTSSTLTASTSVVTPLVQAVSGLTLQSQGGGDIEFNSGSSALVRPTNDNVQQFGSADRRWSSVFTPIIDSGTTGSLSLKTNNGKEQFRIVNGGDGTNIISTFGGVAGLMPAISTASSSDANVGLEVSTKGTGSVNFYSRADIGQKLQFQVIDTASANRNITVTGGNSTPPTLDVTAGGILNITPAVVIAGASLSVGATPATTGTIRIPYGVGITSRNQANSGDRDLLKLITRNSVTDVLSIAGGASIAGVEIQASIRGGAPSTSDIPSGTWAMWRDTGGATTKIYYNNAGSLQSVALS